MIDVFWPIGGRRLHFFLALLPRNGPTAPCLQLVTNIAREAKADETTLQSILCNDQENVSGNVRLAMRFANAVIDQAIVEIAKTSDSVVQRWGRSH